MNSSVLHNLFKFLPVNTSVPFHFRQPSQFLWCSQPSPSEVCGAGFTTLLFWIQNFDPFSIPWQKSANIIIFPQRNNPFWPNPPRFLVSTGEARTSWPRVRKPKMGGSAKGLATFSPWFRMIWPIISTGTVLSVSWCTLVKP